MVSIYCIKDVKIGYGDPFIMKNNGQAIRAFGAALNDSNSPISKFPEDQELWFLGGYDQETGIIVSEEIRCVAQGRDFINNEGE